MSKEKIFEPDIIRIEDDEYYLLYEMMMQSLRTDDVKEGVNKSLTLLRTFLKCGNIYLYRKNESDEYVLKKSDDLNSDLSEKVDSIVNKCSLLTERKGIFYLNWKFSDNVKDLLFLHIKVEEMDSILCINRFDNLSKNVDLIFWERLRETLQIILKRAVSYERNMNAINIDLLTGLDNRNSYEKRIEELQEKDNELIFGLFDLFRLKYVNDYYSHDLGDKYIKNAARILKDMWPKSESITTDKGEKKSFNQCVYRVGGDEFVLLTRLDVIKDAIKKAEQARLLASQMILKEDEPIIVGLNYGIVPHKRGSTIKSTYIEADKHLSEDKKQMYLKLGLDRRR